MKARSALSRRAPMAAVVVRLESELPEHAKRRRKRGNGAHLTPATMFSEIFSSTTTTYTMGFPGP